MDNHPATNHPATNHPDVQAELASVRRQLQDATAIATAHKKQLAEAKTKAKAIIQRNMREAQTKIQLLEEHNKLHAEELSSLKSMLRHVDDQRDALSSQCARLENQLQHLQHENTNLQSHSSSLERDRDDARKSTSDTENKMTSIQHHLQQQIQELRVQLENANRTEHPADENMESPSKVAALWEETRNAKERTADLLKQLDETKSSAEANRNAHEKAEREADSEKASLTNQINTCQCRIKELQEDLKKSETALQDERDKIIQQQKSKSERSTEGGDEKTKILEAKISEMERVVASKQAEIGKVREKAKTYLRELNAEKRAMETKMKEEAETLRKQLEDERHRVEEAEQQMQSASAEVDNCLALIRGKQKNIQMLKMTIGVQESAAQEATREINSLREEFSRYKERARQALREKDTAAVSIETQIEDATTTLRSDLEASQKDVGQLKIRLRQFEGVQRRYEEILERAERAEAAADLLRKDAAGVSNTNFTRLDVLGEKLSDLEAELSTARVAAEDAEAKLETSKMRLEATEKALRGTEVRADEAKRISQKTIAKQQNHVTDLEQELAKARESAASAQRTAAAAAKALSLSSSQNEQKDPKSSPLRPVRREREMGENNAALSYGSPSPRAANRATLSAAMEGHASSLADSPSPRSRGQALESELKLKDQQIMVLTSQIGELGAFLDDIQHEADLRSEQTSLLKEEVKNLDAKLAAADKLRNGAPFSYLRTIVFRYLETNDATLLPVIANVLSFSEEENGRVKARHGSNSSPRASPNTGYFGLNSLLGSKR